MISLQSVMASIRDRFSGTDTSIMRIRENSDRRKLEALSDQLCGVTDVGLVRPNNEDAFHLSDDGKLWIIADGMGGQAAGELASEIAIQAIIESFATSTQEDDVPTKLSKAFTLAQARVLQCSERDLQYRGMGSATLAAYIHDDLLHVCHVGDVRCYVFSDSQLQQLGTDHSLVAEMVAEGVLTHEQARVHKERGRLTQAIGHKDGIEPEINSRCLTSGARVLLCSDGLWESVTDDAISTVLASDGNMRQLASVLANRSISAGGEDNITVVLYEHT